MAWSATGTFAWHRSAALKVRDVVPSLFVAFTRSLDAAGAWTKRRAIATDCREQDESVLGIRHVHDRLLCRAGQAGCHGTKQGSPFVEGGKVYEVAITGRLGGTV